ncbi:MAG: class I SAM-dependent methyltransferase [Planctomycetota bacterium]
MERMSANAKKHLSRNPLKRYFISRFEGALIEMLLARNPESILDMGCGEGFLTRSFRRALPLARIVGVDSDRAAIEIARQRNPDVEFHREDVLGLSFPDHAFDMVICSEVLEHVPDPHAALSELCRVSARHVMLSVPNEPLFRISNLLALNHLRDLGNAPGHIHHWGPISFRRLISSHLTVTEMRLSFPWTIAAGVC